MRSQLWSRELKAVIRRAVLSITRHSMALIVSVWLVFFLLAVIGIPLLVVKPQIVINENPNIHGAGESINEELAMKVAVYLTGEKRIEEVPLEQYIRGVLAAEMPIEFELEALKAQAIAARTYIMRRYVDKDFSNVPVAGAWVTDSVSHQVYLTEEAIAKKWSKRPDRVANLKKLEQAVEETKGLVITHSGYPIVATFFSTSNGFTENSEDYWSLELPYLRSVESPGEDKLSPKFRTTQSFSMDDVINKLEVEPIPVSGKLAMKVIERSDGQRIKRIQVGDKVLSGRDVRERLGLASTQFTWRSVGDAIEFTNYGSGHGVGMSQWGAEQMALSGKKAQEILTHYYKGVRIEKIHNLESIL